MNTHDLWRNLILIWIKKVEAGAFDDEAAAADTIEAYEARIAALEGLVGRQALAIEFLKGGSDYIRRHQPRGMSVAEGCRLMGIARSTHYNKPAISIDDSFEAYGYRRMEAALRHCDVVVNHKKIRRLMREHGLQPRRRRRYVATTDGNHELPIFPNLVKDTVSDGPNQLWVTGITYVAITSGFVYVAVILGAACITAIADRNVLRMLKCESRIDAS